jgi:ABC-type proline/glycine betaine transport system ATPase subunit
VSSTARIAEVAEGILAASEPATVIDESQRVVGALDRESVIRVLADRQVG